MNKGGLKFLAVVLTIVWTIAMCMGTYFNHQNYNISEWIIVIVMGITPYVGVFFLFWYLSKKEKEAKGPTIPQMDPQQKQELLNRMRAASMADLVPVQTPTQLLLGNGEVCFFQFPAVYQEIKTETTGYQRSSTGASIRIAKGVSLRPSSGQSN